MTVGKISVSVIGLGYVGAVCAACWAKLGHRVVGVDIDEGKVAELAAGRSPILEPGLEEETHEQVAEGRLSARSDLAAAVHDTDLSMVCVGTPSAANGRLDLRYVERVCREIGEALATKEGWHLIVIRSTVLPGTTRRVVLPILERASGKRAGVDFGLVFNPEFLREGTAIEDFFAPPKTVVGEVDERSGQTMSDLYDGVGPPAIRTSIEAAEMVKYADNSWHAAKVAFANEIGSICDTLDVSGRRSDGHLLSGHEAEHLSRVSPAGFCLRWLVSAEGCPRALLSRPRTRPRPASSHIDPPEQRAPDRSGLRADSDRPKVRAWASSA